MGCCAPGGGSPTSEEFGLPEAEYIMSIQYCGGWGYRNYALGIQREVETDYPRKFKFIFTKDAGVTGNLEVLIYKVNKPEQKRTVHTKRGKQGYPASNWSAFKERLMKEIDELKWRIINLNECDLVQQTVTFPIRIQVRIGVRLFLAELNPFYKFFT